jgi:hypothetical protein
MRSPTLWFQPHCTHAHNRSLTSTLARGSCVASLCVCLCGQYRRTAWNSGGKGPYHVAICRFHAALNGWRAASAPRKRHSGNARGALGASVNCREHWPAVAQPSLPAHVQPTRADDGQCAGGSADQGRPGGRTRRARVEQPPAPSSVCLYRPLPPRTAAGRPPPDQPFSEYARGRFLCRCAYAFMSVYLCVFACLSMCLWVSVCVSECMYVGVLCVAE